MRLCIFVNLGLAIGLIDSEVENKQQYAHIHSLLSSHSVQGWSCPAGVPSQYH